MKRKPCGVLVAGICGRMGHRVAEFVAGDSDLELVCGIERPDHPSAGKTLSLSGKQTSVAGGFENNIPDAGVLVEFTSPEVTRAAVKFCLERRMAFITGTTGQGEENTGIMREASRRIPLLFSPNMSVGITLVRRLLPKIRNSLGRECDIEIVEKHHRAKKDSPSGTALSLAEAIATASPKEPVFAIKHGRARGTHERDSADIFVHSLRVGGVIGEHTVVMALGGERIEIKHVVESRDCFAYGTIGAIKFLIGKPAGWYTMEDVVGLPAV